MATHHRILSLDPAHLLGLFSPLSAHHLPVKSLFLDMHSWHRLHTSTYSSTFFCQTHSILQGRLSTSPGATSSIRLQFLPRNLNFQDLCLQRSALGPKGQHRGSSSAKTSSLLSQMLSSSLPHLTRRLRKGHKPEPPGARKLPLPTVRLESEKWSVRLQIPDPSPLGARSISSSV